MSRTTDIINHMTQAVSAAVMHRHIPLPSSETSETLPPVTPPIGTEKTETIAHWICPKCQSHYATLVTYTP